MREKERRGFLDDGAGLGRARIDRFAEKTVGKFLIPHNLPEFIFGEQAERCEERIGS